jgi:hypothetical protein
LRFVEGKEAAFAQDQTHFWPARVASFCGVDNDNLPGGHNNVGWMMGERLSEEDLAKLSAELKRLREEHRDLDNAIEALERLGVPDQLQVQRLKKRKLVLKDRLRIIENLLTPDIIA